MPIETDALEETLVAEILQIRYRERKGKMARRGFKIIINYNNVWLL
jgi:hypothetical protein